MTVVVHVCRKTSSRSIKEHLLICPWSPSRVHEQAQKNTDEPNEHMHAGQAYCNLDRIFSFHFFLHPYTVHFRIRMIIDHTGLKYVAASGQMKKPNHLKVELSSSELLQHYKRNLMTRTTTRVIRHRTVLCLTCFQSFFFLCIFSVLCVVDSFLRREYWESVLSCPCFRIYGFCDRY